MERLPKFIILAIVKQSGNIRFTGTFSLDDLTLYRMNGEFYARKKSRLKGKRFRNDDAFEGSRGSAERFKRGNELASQVYNSMPQEERFYKLFCRLKREAILWLKQGKTEDEVVRELEMICADPETPTCHLNLSLPLTVSPVCYAEWYRQEEKVYEYNYKNEAAIERRQAVAFIEGSENVALTLSAEDIWALREGRQEDVLSVVKKMEERLAVKKKRKQNVEKKMVESAQADSTGNATTSPGTAVKVAAFRKSLIRFPGERKEEHKRSFLIRGRNRMRRHALFRIMHPKCTRGKCIKFGKSTEGDLYSVVGKATHEALSNTDIISPA